MTPDPRRLFIPESLASDQAASELVCGWVAGKGKITVMTRTGTGLDRDPAIWGEVLAIIAGNIALSLQDTTGADPTATMRTIKAGLDRTWAAAPLGVGKHSPNL